MTRPYELPYQPEGGLRFDGSSGYVDCGADSSLDVSSTFTLISRMKYYSFPITQNYIFSKQKFGNKLGFIMQVRLATRKFSIWMGDGTNSAFYDSQPIELNRDYYLAVSHDTLNTKMYIDDEKVLDSTTVDMSPATGTKLYIDGIVNFSNATNYEVIIIAEALTQSEIRGLMEGRRLPTEWDCRLWHDYRLGHTRDLSGYGNHGTRVGGTYWMP